jgi:hypothetical protein
MASRLRGAGHGLRALKSLVNVRGLAGIDKRSQVARALLAWKKELLQDLGGEESISAQRMTLVEMAVRTRMYIDHVDGWLLEQPRLVLTRKKSVLPVLLQRQQMVDSLGRLLKELGLERIPKKVPTLQEYLASKTESVAVRKEGAE